MALRYAYGPKWWGLDNAGEFRTPQELAKLTGQNDKGYSIKDYSKYQSDSTRGSKPRVRYSVDFLGNFYMDPNGKYDNMGTLLKHERGIKSVKVSNLDDFREPEPDPEADAVADPDSSIFIVIGSIIIIVLFLIYWIRISNKN